jgi:proteasome lid subunit RPN8/RPN11
MEKIVIPERIETRLQSIANASENEECALLFGGEEFGTAFVYEFVQLTNLDESPVSFLMDEQEIITSVRHFKNYELVGVWHSHPQGMPYPSMKDFEYMNNMPYVWTIYSKKQTVSQSFVRTKAEYPELIRTEII